MHVVRCFERADVAREKPVDPRGDLEVLELELAMTDLDTLGRNIGRLGKKARVGEKEGAHDREVFEKAHKLLEDEQRSEIDDAGTRDADTGGDSIAAGVVGRGGEAKNLVLLGRPEIGGHQELDLVPAAHLQRPVQLDVRAIALRRQLVDGGVVSPIPTRTVQKMGADVIIAVDLITCGATYWGAPSTLVGTFFQSAMIMLRTTSKSLHYRADLLVNLAVIAALVLMQATGAWFVDPLFAFGIVAFLLYGAAGVGRKALDMLMDRELPEADRARIRRIVLAHPETRGLHDLRTRSAGSDRFIELHLELDGHLSLDDAHEITDQVERQLARAFPGAEIILHQEPAGIEDERLDERVARHG